MIINRRNVLIGSAAAIAVPIPPGQADFVPEDYGARGDGRTNDTMAFLRLSQAVNRYGGGTIMLGKDRTYVVGTQIPGARRYLLTPLPILKFQRLARPLRLIGNGARLVAQAGLRFGVFDERSLRPVRTDKGFYDPRGIASPYDAMIEIENCHGPVEVHDVELDGNLGRLLIGGGWGDTGHQLPASGLILRNNRGSESISNVHSHHHGLDGLLLDGDERRTERSRLRNLACTHNGRQGVSIVGGKGYDFSDCEFSSTGSSTVASAPGAGVDIEAEGKTVRDVSFVNCRFADNHGPGLLADSGDSADLRFDHCQFVGTRSWSAWPRKPRMSFESCLFVGALSNAFASKDPRLATRFVRCTFTDDPAKAPNGRAFLSGGPIVDLGGNEGTNVLFDQCLFDLVGQARLPWTIGSIFSDTIMKQRSKVTAYPRGRFIGANRITGPVDLYSSTISGRLIVNGKRVTKW